MKNSKIIFLILSLFYCVAGYAYHWDRDDDYYDESTWWNSDPDWSEWLDNVDITPDNNDDYDDSDDDWGFEDDDWGNEDGNDNDDFDNDNDDYNEGQPNMGDPKPGNTEDKTPTEKLDELTKRVTEVEKLLKITLPTTSLTKRDTGGANAICIDGKIEVADKFFDHTHQDQLAILYHEYIHSQNDKDVAKDENGDLVKIPTDGPPPYTDEQWQRIIEDCEKMIDLIPHDGKEWSDKCIERAMEDNYTYMPSNYYLNEINAYEEQFKAEEEGYFEMSEKFREKQEENLQTMKDKYERALEYERRNGYNPNGSKK